MGVKKFFTKNHKTYDRMIYGFFVFALAFFVK